MKKDTQFTSPERALVALANDLGRDKPYNLAHVDALQDALGPKAAEASRDTLIVMRLRALLAEGQPVQAYRTLMAALKDSPLNLSLQLEFFGCMNAVSDRFKYMLNEDPHNPLIDIYYEILFREAYLNNELQMQYMSYLVAQNRMAEALKLAVPLIELFPAMLGLRDTVEQIAMHIPHPVLIRYLQQLPARLMRETRRSSPNAVEVLALRKKLLRLQELMSIPIPDPEKDAIFREVLGEVSDTSTLDLTLRDFYFYKAVHDGQQGRHWEAIQLLQSLVESDTCNLYFRRSLEIEVRRFCEQKDLKVDARRAHAVLREFANVPYELIKASATAHVKQGDVAEGRRLMESLLKLNPMDNDYLLAALEVAMESTDQEWIESLHQRISSIAAERPWDLKLRTVSL